VVFVDTAEEVQTFSAAKHFDTAEELVSRSFNRPRKEALEDEAAAAGAPGKRAIKERAAAYRKLAAHTEREKKLRNAIGHMQTQKNLMVRPGFKGCTV
jgi:U3 small nucleolar RNA-associated protein 11